MTGAYLSYLPRAFIRSIAGFPKEGKGYFLPHAQEIPPAGLYLKIWPETDVWLERMEAYRPNKADNEVVRLDLAGSGFLRLLRALRVVLLQDSVVLRKEFPRHPLWKDPFFDGEEYRRFARRVEDSPRSGGEAATRGRHLGDSKRPVGRAVDAGTPRRGRKVVVGVSVSVVCAGGADMDPIGTDGYLDWACGPRRPSVHGGYGRACPSTRLRHAGFWNGGAIRTRVAGVDAGAAPGSACSFRPSCSARPDRPRPAGAAERL